MVVLSLFCLSSPHLIVWNKQLQVQDLCLIFVQVKQSDFGVFRPESVSVLPPDAVTTIRPDSVAAVQGAGQGVFRPFQAPQGPTARSVSCILPPDIVYCDTILLFFVVDNLISV